MVSNIRIEVIRNIADMPTLAAMDASNLKKLREIQLGILRDEKVMGNGNNGWLSEHESFYKYSKIRDMSEEKKAALKKSGVQLNDDECYKMVVPLLDDDDSFMYENSYCEEDRIRKLIQFNFGYEQFRFLVDQPGGSIKDAITNIASIVDSCEAQLLKRGLKGFASPTNSMCDLNNLGGFQIRLTLSLNFST